MMMKDGRAEGYKKKSPSQRAAADGVVAVVVLVVVVVVVVRDREDGSGNTGREGTTRIRYNVSAQKRAGLQTMAYG